MGRKPLPPELKRHTLHITLPKYLIDKLKEKDINISKTIEETIIRYLQIEYLLDELKEKNINVTQIVEKLLKNYLKGE